MLGKGKGVSSWSDYLRLWYQEVTNLEVSGRSGGGGVAKELESEKEGRGGQEGGMCNIDVDRLK